MESARTTQTVLILCLRTESDDSAEILAELGLSSDFIRTRTWTFGWAFSQQES